MNKLISIIICTAALSLSLSASIRFVGTEIFKIPKTYGKDTKIGLEVYNKNPNDLWVEVNNGGDFSDTKKIRGNTGQVSRDVIGQFEIDITKDTFLAVWLKDPGPVQKMPGYTMFGNLPAWLKPKPDFIYSFPKNKTIYITWDKDNFPRPETGVLKGILGKTDSGLTLSKSKNVTKDDIQNVYPRKRESY